MHYRQQSTVEVEGGPQTASLPGANDQVALGDSVDNIGPTDNANQLAVSDHRNTLDLALREQLSNFAYMGIFRDHDQFVGHDVAHTQPLAIDLADDIGLR